MNGIGLTLVIVVLAAAGFAAWWIVQRSHRFTTRTGLEQMGRAVAAANEVHEQLSNSEAAPMEEATPRARPIAEPAPPRDHHNREGK